MLVGNHLRDLQYILVVTPSGQRSRVNLTAVKFSQMGGINLAIVRVPGVKTAGQRCPNAWCFFDSELPANCLDICGYIKDNQ